MNSISTALAGIQSATSQFDNAAQKIANSGTPKDDTDIAAQMIAMTVAEHNVKFNAMVLHTQEDMDHSLLDIRA